jgi:DNA-binding LacI/PurR family transcriptional regulator
MPTRKAPARLNMKSVAIRAGVSTATVSRVINGLPAVSEELAERVRRVIKELDFVPNPIAITLKHGRSKTYGLIIPDLANPFFPEFLVRFEEILVENDHELLLATTQSSEEKLVHSVRRMLTRHVDGVVLMASEFDTRAIEPLFHHRIPIVTVDRRQAEKGAGDVAIDFEGGFRKAVLHLRDLGHSQIGFIGGTEGLRTSQIRLEAFQQALRHAGLTYKPKFIRHGDYRVGGGEAAMRSLLKAPVRPTAVMTANDLTAIGVLRALHATGISVPSQMSVVGFDDIMLSSAIIPSLTTIHISKEEMAQACIKALDHTKANVNKRGLLLSISGSLVIRESTAPPTAQTAASAIDNSMWHMRPAASMRETTR